MAKFLTHDQWLRHNPNQEYQRGNFIKNWKKEGHVDPKDPTVRFIDIWLHRIAVPQARWRHPWRKIEIRENKETKRSTREVWSYDFVCHEEENVLKKQYQRDDDGFREVFPEYCPSCRLNEVVYQIVTTGKFVYDGEVIAKGKLSWTEPLFQFEGSDATKSTIYHAAGLYNGFKDVAKDSEEAAELQDAGIFLKTAFRENTTAKCSYLFAVVENDDPEPGIKMAEETQLLGQKVMQLIAKSREEHGDDEGNPFNHPFVIRWKHSDKRGLSFDKQYDAVKISNQKIPLTDQIDAFISSPPRDWFSNKLEPGDAKTFRATMERHATQAAQDILPWDWIFDVAEPAAETEGKGAAKSRPSRAAKPPVEDEEESPPPKPVGRTKVSKATAAPPPKKEPELIACDDCGTMMRPTQRKCLKCNAEYNVEGEEEEVVPPPNAKAQAKKAPPPAEEAAPTRTKPVASANGRKAAAQPPPKAAAPPPDDAEEEEEDEELPF